MPSYSWLASQTFRLDEIESSNPVAKYLWLVPERVGYFLDYQGSDSNLVDDLLSVAALALVVAYSQMPVTVRYPKAYLRKSIDRALADYVEENGLLRPSARTCRRWKEADHEPIQYSLDKLTTFKRIRTLVQQAGKSESEIRELSAKLTAKPKDDHSQIVECYRHMYSLCRDDIDREVLEARWDGGLCLSCPPHVRTIARQTRLSIAEVRRRLTRICQRYCRGLCMDMPRGRLRDGVHKNE